jgi:hypothetical protein
VGGVYAGRVERTPAEAVRMATYLARKGEHRQAFDLYMEASTGFLETGRFIAAGNAYALAELEASYLRPPAKVDPGAFVD